MAAFDSSLAGPPSIRPPGIGSNKYDEYDLEALQSVAPQENAPSQPSGGAASQGAFGDPASAGGPQAAFMSGDEGKGKGEARKPASDFHKKWMDSSDEGKEAIAASMEQQFGDLSLEGAYNKMIKDGGEAALELGSRFGITPSSDQADSKEAFKGREEALNDYGVQMDDAKEQKINEKKSKERRFAMGGFLMDVGLRILASNRQDAGGAIGEGALGARQSRKDEKRFADEKKQKDADRKRRITREDEADEMGRAREARAVEKSEYDKSQRGRQEAAEDRKGLTKIIGEDGKVHFVQIKGGVAVDESGEPILSDGVGLSKESIAAGKRRYDATLNAKIEKIKALDDYKREGNWPELEGLKGKELTDAITAIAVAEMDAQGYGGGDQSLAEDDPLGLL